MKRSITQKKYEQVKEDNHDCLNWDNLRKLKFIKEWDYWVIIRPTNNCEYKVYNNHKVKSHYLIVPKKDYKDLQDMAPIEISEWNRINFWLNDKYAKERAIINWKTRAFRSIDKYHGHVIVMAQTNENQ